MSVLVVNSGSSSLKIKIFSDIDQPAIVSGNLEKIGEEHSFLHCKFSQNKIDKQITCADHREGLQQFFSILRENDALVDITAIGHRVVHGGEDFSQPVKIDDSVIATIEKNIPLAPLHNPANLKGIQATMHMFPNVTQVAVFDTAFHQTMPECAYRYAVPDSFYQQEKIRRYGFHGSSHQYVSKEAARILQKPIDATNLITLHLGNGASVAAIKNGKSVDTSMGMTPLEGLIMGTRCGDIDPGVLLFLLQKYSHDELDKILNKKSGLLGLCGSNDMRDIESQNTTETQRAIKMMVHRIQKYIGSYYVQLPQLDALVFTAGIGENSTLIRKLCCANLVHMGIELCEEKNSNITCGEIQKSHSKIKILVIPTNEEMEIARQTYTLTNGQEKFMLNHIIWDAVFAGILASLACGLGVLPLCFKKIDNQKQIGIGYGFAGGLMFSASVYNLILPGLQMEGHKIEIILALKVVGGILAGTFFIWLVERYMDTHESKTVENWGGKGVVLIFIAMCIHSIPEGVAVGVGYTSGELQSSSLGDYIALAIGIHNIPEGLAVAIPMRLAGMSIGRCFLMAVFTSIPQPLAAIPAVFLAWFFQPLMPSLMGFAAGAMIFLVILEMIPDALRQESAVKIAWAFIWGFCTMILLQIIL